MKAIDLVNIVGLTVKNSHDLILLSPISYIQTIHISPCGMFQPDFPNYIFLFQENTKQEDVDYVLAHEMGHAISGKLNLGMHGYRKDPSLKHLVNYTSLYEEECRADYFAALLADQFNYNMSNWVKERITKYQQRISKEREKILIEDVNNMMTYLNNLARNAS